GQSGDIKVQLTRANVQYPSSKTAIVMQGRVAVITIPQFNETASRDVGDAIRMAQKAGGTSYIVDIRKNSGGLLDQIIETASLFLDGGVILSTAPPPNCGSTEEVETYNARRGFKLKDAPVIVLTGKDTGSGAELFAAALSERGRARLVGQTTAGM